MSSIAFNSMDSGEVLVGGAERAWAGSVCNRMLTGILDLCRFPMLEDAPLSRLIRMLKPNHYIRDMIKNGREVNQVARQLETALVVSDHALEWNGHDAETFGLSLNTALALGSDAVKLLARIHGCCEIHGWIAGKNRWWASDIIEEGLAVGVFRKARQTQYGNWPAVVEMLRVTSQTPVVMSYSVTESFPGVHLAMPPSKPYSEMTEDEQIARDEEAERWYSLPEHERWNQSFAALEAKGGGLEIKQENWKTFRFTHGLSAMDLLADDWETRLDRAFPED